jgi:adenylate kinase
MSKIVVLIGAPGAGKGTQARLLQERLGLPQISTGDMFRALAEAQTPLAKEIRQIQTSGALIPDEVVIRMVAERTAKDDCRDGYILDGFPRTTVQAEMLERIATAQGKDIVAILVDVPPEILAKRMTGRRSCPVCREIYNVYFKPPKLDNVCDLHPNAQLEQRSDDRPEKVKVRMETYERQTQPLLDYYEKSGRLHKVDGTRDPEAINLDTERIVGSK